MKNVAMRRAISVSLLALAALLALAPGASATPAQVSVGKVRLGSAPGGRPSLLIPVTYPTEMAGRHVRLSVGLYGSDGRMIYAWSMSPVANAGALRAPERRKSFVFVHRIDLDRADAELLPGSTARVTARAHLDADRDGTFELRARQTRVRAVPSVSGGEALCSTPSKRWMRPGRVLVTTLPICTQPTRWTIAERPEAGSARIRGHRLIYSPGTKFRGTASIALAGQRIGAAAAVTPVDTVSPVQIVVSSAGSPVVRALGDSVTAGFGYYEEGRLMPFSSLLSCKPGESSYDDACSSNSKVRSNTVKKVEYAADYGLANNVSWAAQWANEHGVTNFKNYAVSGSEPSDWFGEGQFAETAKQLASEDPDYVLLTMGANPLLSDMLFGVDNMGCAIWADVFGRYRECLEAAFAEIKLQANLKTLYSNLVKSTNAEIFVMQYHLSIPSTALAYSVDQIAEMGALMNREIAAVAEEVSPSRITVVAPPHFNVGLDLAPFYPPKYKCEGRFFTSHVDGPSVQSTATQDELESLHPVEFCAGPASGPPWVISGDTGIHPSAAGYAQMAAQVPAPE